MITKVRYSKNPGKTIDYILNPKKGAHVVIARGVSALLILAYSPKTSIISAHCIRH